MTQYAIIGLMLSNLLLGFIALRPATKEPINWQTLVIWRSSDWKISAMEWREGAFTKEQVEKGGYKPLGVEAVLETFTVPGKPADAEWIQSLPTPRT